MFQYVCNYISPRILCSFCILAHRKEVLLLEMLKAEFATWVDRHKVQEEIPEDPPPAPLPFYEEYPLSCSYGAGQTCQQCNTRKHLTFPSLMDAAVLQEGCSSLDWCGIVSCSQTEIATAWHKCSGRNLTWFELNSHNLTLPKALW